METRKIVVPAIVAVVTLIILTVGATYAYFAVGVNRDFGTSTVTAEAGRVGGVALSTGKTLSMELTALQMMKGNADIPYYASSEGVTTTETTENIGQAVVTGAGTYNCTYDLTVSASGTNSMLTAYQGMDETEKSEGQIVLTLNGTEYDFYDTTFPIELTGIQMNGLVEGADQYITASLMLVNKVDKDQTDLAGTDITLTFTPSNFSCTAIS